MAHYFQIVFLLPTQGSNQWLDVMDFTLVLVYYMSKNKMVVHSKNIGFLYSSRHCESYSIVLSKANLQATAY